MHPKLARAGKAGAHYGLAFALGICLILIPSSSFLLKSPSGGAITDRQYGLVFLPMIMMAVLITLFLRFWTSRIGTRKTLAICLGTLVAYLALLGHTVNTQGDGRKTFLLLCAANFFLGIGFGGVLSILNHEIGEIFQGRRDAALAALHAFLGVGCALSPQLVASAFERGAWEQAMEIALALLIVFGIAVLGWALHPAVPEPAGEGTGDRPAPKERLPRGAALFLFLCFLYGITESLVGNWSIPYLQDEKRFSLQTASFCLSLFWFMVTAGRVAATLLTFRMDAKLLYRISPVIMVLALMLIVKINNEWVIPLPYILIGLGCSYYFPLSVSLSSRYHPAWRSWMSAWCVSALMAGVGVGSSCVGMLRDVGFLDLSRAFELAALSSALLAAMSFLRTSDKASRLLGESGS